VLSPEFHFLLFTEEGDHIMPQSSSQVSSGNIAPMIKGPEKDTKEVIVLGGVILLLGGLLAAAWLYSQSSDQGKVAGTIEQANIQDLFTKSTVSTQALVSTPHPTQVTSPVVSIADILHTDIYFEVGRKGLTEEGKAQLSAQAAILSHHEEYSVLIQGYTDQQGSASYNKQLGMKRAEAVKTELVNAGIAEYRIKTVSLGEEGVLCVDTSDVCRHMNRRVHLEVRKIGQEHMVLPSAPTTPSDSPETTIDSSSTMGEGGATRESFVPAWSDPTLIPEPTKGK
jgi:peptidoglycan-associated lipoprotein